MSTTLPNPSKAQRKYEFTGKTRQRAGAILKQIRALRSLELSSVKAGQLGGWLESESNLSHGGECWVYPQAQVRGYARVEDDCRVQDHAIVEGHAHLSDFILLHDEAIVRDYARIRGSARLQGRTLIYGHAQISCGEDGPQIIPNVELNFDVAYGLDYVVLGFSYAGYVLAVSQAGQLCLADNANTPRWSGTLPEFNAWVQQHYRNDTELVQAGALAGAYLQQWSAT